MKYYGTWQLDEGLDKFGHLDIKNNSSRIILTINEPVYENWIKSVFYRENTIYGESSQGDKITLFVLSPNQFSDEHGNYVTQFEINT